MSQTPPKGNESLQEGQHGARGEAMRAGQQNARGEAIREGQQSARGGPIREGQQSARGGPIREGQQSARGEGVHEGQDSVQGGGLREGKEDARENALYEGQRSARGSLSEEADAGVAKVGGPADAGKAGDDYAPAKPPKSARAVKIPGGHSGGGTDMADSMPLEPPKSARSVRLVDDSVPPEPPKSARSVKVPGGPSGGGTDVGDSKPLELLKFLRSGRHEVGRSGAETDRQSGVAHEIGSDDDQDGNNNAANVAQAGPLGSAKRKLWGPERDEDGHGAHEAGDAPGAGSHRPGGRKQWGVPVGNLRLAENMQMASQENSFGGKRIHRGSQSSDTSSDVSFNTRNIVENFRVNLKGFCRWGEDENAMQVAFEQLDNLAENTKTVQTALETNRIMIEQQLMAARRRIVRVAFRAWWCETGEAHKRRRLAKQRFIYLLKMKASIIMRAWRDLIAPLRKVWRLKPSAVKLMDLRLMFRVWVAWKRMTRETQFQLELERREEELELYLEERWRVGVFRRANNVMYRRRLSRAFKAFLEGVNMKKQKASFLQHAIRLLRNSRNHRLLFAWQQIAEYRRAKSRRKSAVDAKMRKRKMQRILVALYQVTEQQRLRKHCVRWFRRRRMQRGMRPAFTTMAIAARIRREKKLRLKNARLRLDHGKKVRAFRAVAQLCAHKKWRKKLAGRAIKRMQRWRLALAFRAWVFFMQMEADGKAGKLEEQMQLLENENRTLKADVARLGRIIDAVDWGKERVAELVKAGEVLSGERAALTKLIGRLRREQVEMDGKRSQHDEEIRNIKDRLLCGNFPQRNKLLVKGVSSFNSLVRALKADVLASANAKSEPDLLYTVDKLAMDQISVFPDGELHIKAVKDRNGFSTSRPRTVQQPHRTTATAAATAGSITPNRSVSSDLFLQPQQRASAHQDLGPIIASRGSFHEYVAGERQVTAPSRNSGSLTRKNSTNLGTRGSSVGSHVMWSPEINDSAQDSRVSSHNNSIAMARAEILSDGQDLMQEQFEGVLGVKGVGRVTMAEDMEDRGEVERAGGEDVGPDGRMSMPPRPPPGAGGYGWRRDVDARSSPGGNRATPGPGSWQAGRAWSPAYSVESWTSRSAPLPAGRNWSPAHSTRSC